LKGREGRERSRRFEKGRLVRIACEIRVHSRRNEKESGGLKEKRLNDYIGSRK